jgi:hypothetical protein
MTDGTTRNAILREILSDRRRELHNEVQSRIRDGRTDRPMDVRHDLEAPDADIHGEIDVALLQMRAETLTRGAVPARRRPNTGPVSNARAKFLSDDFERCRSRCVARRAKRGTRRSKGMIGSSPSDTAASRFSRRTSVRVVLVLPWIGWIGGRSQNFPTRAYAPTMARGPVGFLNRATRRSATSC